MRKSVSNIIEIKHQLIRFFSLKIKEFSESLDHLSLIVQLILYPWIHKRLEEIFENILLAERSYLMVWKTISIMFQREMLKELFLVWW